MKGGIAMLSRSLDKYQVITHHNNLFAFRHIPGP
jgi:hypothetical protein